MRDCTESFCPIDHIAIDTTDIEGMRRFLEAVFGMTVTRTKTAGETITDYWLDGGVQLTRVSEEPACPGRCSHIGFQCKDVDAVLHRAEPFGAKPVEGKGHHWFEAFGVYFEMKVC